MTQLAEHPTVKQFREREAVGNEPVRPQTLDASWLRRVCVEAGAGDVGFVGAGRPIIADQEGDILARSLEPSRLLWVYDLGQVDERFQFGIGNDPELLGRFAGAIHPVACEPKDFGASNIEEIQNS